MKVIKYRSNITTFVPSVGDFYRDENDKLYIVTKRVLQFDGTFKIFMKLLRDE